ncbi:MAG: hypothetical protein HQK83_12095 [Fibrobacteria bacterium]|nr:hypothetical protein [Fibrobacteria bacterium]
MIVKIKTTSLPGLTGQSISPSIPGWIARSSRAMTVVIKPFFIFLLISIGCIVAAPIKGQIVRDPVNPTRMIYYDTFISVLGKQIPKPCLFAGPGDPEVFFYEDTEGNLKLLKDKEARCTYITAYLKDKPGGAPGTGTDLDITLDKWELLMTELEEAGIITVFFLFDDMQNLPTEWKTFVDKTVAKFKHHKLWIWAIAEEYGEAMSPDEVLLVAARIREKDDRNHIIGIHHDLPNLLTFNDDEVIDMYLLRADDGPTRNEMYKAWKSSNGKKIINMSESAPEGIKQGIYDRATIRKWNWSSVMGGASAIQVLEMGATKFPAEQNETARFTDCSILMDWFEKTTVNAMEPNDDIAGSGTLWVMADERKSYIAYTDNAGSGMAIKGLVNGPHQAYWIDILSGKEDTVPVDVTSETQSFSIPSGYGKEVAVWIIKGEKPLMLWNVSQQPQNLHIGERSLSRFYSLSGRRIHKKPVEWSIYFSVNAPIP